MLCFCHAKPQRLQGRGGCQACGAGQQRRVGHPAGAHLPRPRPGLEGCAPSWPRSPAAAASAFWRPGLVVRFLRGEAVWSFGSPGREPGSSVGSQGRGGFFGRFSGEKRSRRSVLRGEVDDVSCCRVSRVGPGPRMASDAHLQ